MSGHWRRLRRRLAAWPWATWEARLVAYAQLVRLHRPIGTLLLLWPTLWALWIAGGGRPDPHIVLVFALGVLLMRSAGCAINDFADRKFDPEVARTRDRPLAAGLIAPWEALAVFAGLCLIAFMLVLTLTTATVLWSLGAVALAALYPLAKRYTWLPQVVLGTAFAWAIPMAFVAQLGFVPRVGWLLFVSNILWVTAYDTYYAMVDRADDLRIGVRSTAILFGDLDRLMIGLLQAGFIAGLLVTGRFLGLGGHYYAGVAVAALLALYHQVLIRKRVPARCFQAFVNSHWQGAAVFAGLLLHYLG